MKKSTITIAFLLFAAFQTMFAANINIVISGFTYSPSSTTAVVGDVVTIAANTTHPLVQVDQTNWNANSPTPVNGWTNQTTAYTFTVTTTGTFYYGCANHMATMQMKGMITMNAAGINQATAAAYNISLYPNPITGDEFSVKMEGYAGASATMMVYNEQGQLLETHAITAEITPVKTKLPSGNYFYTIMVGTQPVFGSKFMTAATK